MPPQITDEGVAQVFDAILADTRILLMGFRKNKVSGIWQENFALLMREHPTLQQASPPSICRRQTTTSVNRTLPGAPGKPSHPSIVPFVSIRFLGGLRLT